MSYMADCDIEEGYEALGSHLVFQPSQSAACAVTYGATTTACYSSHKVLVLLHVK